MLSWIIIGSLAVAEPVVSDQTEPVLTATEIYGLLDEERWSKGAIEAHRLIMDNPTEPLSHLTLGDALAQYPNDSGDVHAAFDAWMTAKKLSNPRSKLHAVAEQRLKWALERSGIIKLEPSQFVGADGFAAEMTVEVFATEQVDWTPRIDRVKGAVYITNIPLGEVMIKVNPSAELPTLVYKSTVEKGSFFKLPVPTNVTTLDNMVEQDVVSLYREDGRSMVDGMVQSLVMKPNASFHAYASTMVVLPIAPVPADTKAIFVSPHGEQIEYDNGVQQTLIGGLYVVAVEKNGVLTYGDMVVHPDLSAETIRDFLLEDDKRRSAYKNPDLTIHHTPSVEHSSAYGILLAPTTVAESNTPPKPERTEAPPTVPAHPEENQQAPVVDHTSVETTSVTETEELPVEPISLDEAEEVAETAPVSDSMASESSTVPLSESGIVFDTTRSAKMERLSLVGVGVGALYTAFSLYRSDANADLANAETTSQQVFETYQNASSMWEQQMWVGSIATTQVLSFYLGTKWLQRCCIVEPSDETALSLEVEQ